MTTIIPARQPATPSLQHELPRFARILVPLDGSPVAEEALPTAITLVQRAGAQGKLLLAHVNPMGHFVFAPHSLELPPKSPPHFLLTNVHPLEDRLSAPIGPFELPARGQEERDTYLASIEAAAQAQGVPAEAIQTEGDPATGIVDMAYDHHADLILLVTQAREGLCYLVHGSVADHVLQSATVPVLLLKRGEAPLRAFPSQGQPQLLVPLDGSALAESVLPHISSLAQQLGATVTLLRSLDLPNLPPVERDRAGAAIETVHTSLSPERQAAQQYLEQTQQRLQAQGIPTTILVTEGDAAYDIAEHARTLEEAGKAVLLVLATHGHTGINRWLYGSVAGAVLHLAAVPLLVIRSQ